MNTDTPRQTAPAPGRADDDPATGDVGELLHRIGNDLSIIVRDEVELVRNELKRGAKRAIVEISVGVLSAIVSLIGLGMLCMVVVAALAPVIPALWARLLVMAIIYLVVGGVLAGAFAKRLGGHLPRFTVPVHEAKATLAGIGEALSREQEAGSHA
jgi:hypothetical protein